jgi:protein-S-isoprenylcysteine O-methyltransferase Ste14
MMANPWPLNGVLYVAILIAQAFRMMGEERVLRGWDEYQAYAARVRWRRIPGVF